MTTPPPPPPLPGRRPDPDEPSEFEPPTFATFETPSFESIVASSSAKPEPEQQFEPEAEPDSAPEPGDDVADPPPAPQPTPVTPTVATSYAQPPGPPQPAAWTPPPAPEPPAAAPAGRTLTRYLVTVGVLFVALVLILLYAFVIRDDTTTGTASTGSSSTTPTPTGTASPTAPPQTAAVVPAVGATDGPFAFSVNGNQTGATVTSGVDGNLVKTAAGVFVVVDVSVTNTSADIQTFLSTLQVLKADGATFPPDDEASFYAGGGVVTVDPGEVMETAIAFDVPVGTAPTSIELHGTPGSPGVDLPL